MGRPKKNPTPAPTTMTTPTTSTTTTTETPFDDETIVTTGAVPAPEDAVADYLDINNPAHANLTYAELQALAHDAPAAAPTEEQEAPTEAPETL